MRISVVLFSVALAAQQADPPKPAETEPAKTSTFVYQGKPIALGLSCSDQEIDSFGLTCTEDSPCDVFLELAAVESVGSKYFVTGNFHTSNATLWSLLLTSADSGKTWTESHERVRSAALEQIQFIDFENGWVAGETLVSLPRDPFFLRTDDGGKTWRKQTVSSESRVGAIEQFNFESKSNGALLIDRTQTGDAGGRHEFYETNTGGDSWMLREVSPRPLKLKRPRALNPDLRVRADAPSKSFRVERRAAGKWEAVAAFLIRAGECKPAELRLAEPPPETESVSTKDAVTELAPYGRRPAPSLKKKKR